MKEENQPATLQRRITVPLILRKIEVKTMRNRNNIAEIIDRTVYTTLKNNLGGEHSLSFQLFTDVFDEEIDTAVCNKFNVTDTADIPKDSVIEAILFILSIKPSEEIIQTSKAFENEFQEYIYHFFEDMPKDSLAYQQLISNFLSSKSDSAGVITDSEIGCLEYEMERAIEAHLYGVKRSKFYRYLYNECTNEIDTDFGKEFGTDDVSELPAERFIEAMQFLGEWSPSVDILEMISEVECHKMSRKVTKR